MKQYHDLIKLVLENGTPKQDRTGTGTISLFGTQSRYDLSKGFPLVTTKKMFTKGIIAELLWFIEGSTDERRLAEIQYGKSRDDLINKRTIWTDNADRQGAEKGHINTILHKELGPVYGAQWRAADYDKHGQPIDQLQNVIDQIKSNPDSRRLIVDAWNVAEIDEMALPPCHTLFQFYVSSGKLSCILHQRSADIFLGVPYNIASYSLLTMMIAQICNLELGEFIHNIGDAHIYSNHVDQCNLQLSREEYPLPTMALDPNITTIDDFTMDSFTLNDYKFHPKIEAEMAV